MIISIVGLWIRGFIALLVIGTGAYLLYCWHDNLPSDRPVVVIEPLTGETNYERQQLNGFRERLSFWQPGWDTTTALLVGGLGLLALSIGGRLVSPRLWLPTGADEPRQERGGELHKITRPDGTILNVEVYGPATAPPVVLTHGWGGDATEWYYLKKDLVTQFRLIAWDLPGLGQSTQPTDRNFSLDKFASDLNAVLDLAGNRPAILVGHSIGGMTMLTFARLFPQALGTRVAGMVLVHTSYTNPLYTKVPTWLLPVLQKPVLEPLCWLTVALSPVVWLMNWMSYINGSAHWSNHKSMFAGTETRGQLDFVTQYMIKASPAVIARGTLGMFRYDATEVLPRISIPVLVIAADKDQTTIPEASKRIANEIPGAELITLSPARHMGLIEHHAEFSAVVNKFCLGVQSGSHQ